MNCLFLIATALSMAALAEDPPPSDAPMTAVQESLTVTGSRTPVDVREAGRSISVLDGETLEAQSVHAIPEALQLVPGVDVRRRGVLGAQADASIRGSSFEEVVILLDGIPMNDPQTGHHNLDLPLPLAAVEKTEVLFGPGSSLYGANAAGGVIQLFTRRPTATAARFEIFGGENALLGGNVGLDWNGTEGSHYHTVSAEKFETDGHKEGTEVDSGSLWYRGGLDGFGWSLGASDRDFGAQNFYSTRFPNQLEFTEARLASLRWDGYREGFEIGARASFRQHDDLFILDRFVPSLLANTHQSDAWDLEGSVRRSMGALDVLVGTGYIDEGLDSSNLGLRSRDRFAAFASVRGEHSGLGWQAALHVDRTEGEWRANPSASLVAALGPGRVRGSVGTAYRLPSFTELHYRDPASAGNPDLAPEESWTAEVGYDLGGARRWLAIALFQREGSDLIDFVLAPGDDLFRAQNLRRVTTRGAEFTAGTRVLGGSRWAMRIDGGLTHLDASGDEPLGVSAYVFDYLRNRFLVRAEGLLPAGFSYGSGLSWNDRNEQDAYWRLDLRLAWGLGTPELTLYLEANNVTDELYFEQGDVEMPGRWMTLGVRYRLGRATP